MAIDHNAGSRQVDAVSMVANKLNVDLSATIKPDANKGADAVGAAAAETNDKLGNYKQIEANLHQQLSEKTGGPSSKGGLSHGQAIGLLGMIGIGPSNNIAPSPAPAVQVPGIQVHAAEVIGGPSSFKTSSSSDKGKGKDDMPSVYQDAMGGQWNFKTGFEVTGTPISRAPMSPQQTREMNMASRSTIDTLGADAVREDLGQINETKKRLGQQGQQALDDAERLGLKVAGTEMGGLGKGPAANNAAFYLKANGPSL